VKPVKLRCCIFLFRFVISVDAMRCAMECTHRNSQADHMKRVKMLVTSIEQEAIESS
jgi:hypothetical protein